MFEEVAAVAGVDPAALAGALFRLTDDDIAGLTLAVAVALAAQRVVSAVTARQRSAIETVARRCDEQCEREASAAIGAELRPHHLSGQQLADGPLAPLLQVSPRTMSTKVDQARRVVCALPAVQALGWAGDLEPYRVDAVVRESYAAPSARLHEFEARVLEGAAAELSCPALRRRARRDVRVRPGDCSGMTRLVADLPTRGAWLAGRPGWLRGAR